MRSSRHEIHLSITSNFWATSWPSVWFSCCHVPGNEKWRRDGNECESGWLHWSKWLFCCMYLMQQLIFFRIVLVLHFQDKLACERFSGRARRDTNLSNNLSEVSTISFRVELKNNDTNQTSYVAANNTGIMSLILTLSFIIMATIICLIIKFQSCISC